MIYIAYMNRGNTEMTKRPTYRNEKWYFDRSTRLASAYLEAIEKFGEDSFETKTAAKRLASNTKSWLKFRHSNRKTL